MSPRSWWPLCVLALLLQLSHGWAVSRPNLRGSLASHDPSTIIKCQDRYYLFSTGRGISSKWSTNKVFWTEGPRVFTNAPVWTTNAVPGFDGNIWAPDIMFLNGKYCLYYAISTWGSQVSAIGLVTSPTLNPADPAYRWTDQGVVIQSTNGNPYNTIDPGVMVDAAGNPWMVFGSYWNGIYLVQLDPLTGLRISTNSPTYRLAWNNSIEASCLYRRGGYYYLFVNWGSCCIGVNSTYHIRVGRSTSITGPYRDRNGVDMVNAGGTLFLEGSGKFTGPGHAGVFSENGSDWLSYHYYDAGAYAPWYGAYGVAEFDGAPLSWTADDWPVFTNDWSALYNFETDARDEQGQYYGMLEGGASIQTDPVRGRVLDLSGSNQIVRLPAGVGFARTFAAVVNWRGGNPWQRIFDFGVDTTRYVMLTPSSGNGRLRLDIRAGGVTQTLEWANPLPINVWSHVAVTLNGRQGVLYYNGAPVATNTGVTLSPLSVLAQTNHLGRSKFAADPDFNGQIASFRVYGRALSATEIAAPLPVIAQPADGASYLPGAVIAFQGGATDFADVAIAPTGLVWMVQYRFNGTNATVLGPLVGATSGSFTIPGGGSAATNGSYRVLLLATDAAGRRATNVADIFPASAGSEPVAWASYYPFNAGAADASNRFNGTLVNGASIQSDATRGNVVNLSGASQYVNLPGAVAGMRAISGWVKWNGGNPWQRLFDFGQNNNTWVMLTPLDVDGKMQCAITTDRANYVRTIQSSAPLPVGVWTHIAAVFDGRQGILYTNGQVAAINNSVNLLPSDVVATKAYLGRSQYTADAYFNGRLDSVRLSSRALSAFELFAPVPRIAQPAPGALFTGGSLLSFAGTATDYTEALLPPGAFTWTVEFHHDGVVDSALGPLTGVTTGSLAIPTTGPSSTNVFYRVRLRVADAAGNQQATTADVPPRTSRLNFATVPDGLQVVFDGQSLTAPTSVVSVVGMKRSLAVPSPQSAGGSSYNFLMWSDGGAATHDISVPTNEALFTASYLPPEIGLTTAGGSLQLSWPAWAAAMQLYSTTNLSPPAAWVRVTNVPATSNGVQSLSLPADGAQGFYRLQLP